MFVTRAVLTGRIGSPGVGVGRILIVRRPTATADRATPVRPPFDERARLSTALETAAGELEALARQLAQRGGEETAAIFEAQPPLPRAPGIAEPAMRATA